MNFLGELVNSAMIAFCRSQGIYDIRCVTAESRC